MPCVVRSPRLFPARLTAVALAILATAPSWAAGTTSATSMQQQLEQLMARVRQLEESNQALAQKVQALSAAAGSTPTPPPSPAPVARCRRPAAGPGAAGADDGSSAGTPCPSR